MQTKLTLRLDEALIERAKSMAQQQGTSVSRLVAGYIAGLDVPQTASRRKKSSVTHSLRGVLHPLLEKNPDLNYRETYRAHLEEKYR